jgi:hypothetical protein
MNKDVAGFQLWVASILKKIATGKAFHRPANDASSVPEPVFQFVHVNMLC